MQTYRAVNEIRQTLDADDYLVGRGYFSQDLPRRAGPERTVPERLQRRQRLPGRGGAQGAEPERLERRPIALRRRLGDFAEVAGLRGRGGRRRRRKRGRPLLLEGVLLVAAARAPCREVEVRLLRRGHPAAPPPTVSQSSTSPS